MVGHLKDYSAVLFDLDSTLTETNQYPVNASKWMLSQLGRDTEGDVSRFVEHLVSAYFARVQQIVEGLGYKDPCTIVRESMEAASVACGLEADSVLLDEATRLFRTLHVEYSQLRPGALEILKRLRARGVRLGIITNSFEGHLRIILARLGVTDYFKVLVDPGDVKAYKPMPKPFEYALRVLERVPSETLYVGDEYYADVVGANRVGMDTVWINLRGHTLDEYISRYGTATRPVIVLRDLRELLHHL
ncbi:MAG: HAD family hydrolase [Candidatus Thorarchaeota archaeon]|nr:HAD family hydrolase [Candidatus Thorarchaeota archaeon]